MTQKKVEKYLVGGFVRDSLLGVKSKDLDYTVVAPSYKTMRDYIVDIGGEIFLETPSLVTIRARVGKVTSDYVLSRKEYGSIDGRHPERVEVGTLYDDLARRDFTMNAIAIDEAGEFIDPFNGRVDIENRLIRCVGSAEERIREDYLRLARAARFCITKKMKLHNDIIKLFGSAEILNNFVRTLPADRIRDEVKKMFEHSTTESIEFFGKFPLFSKACFEFSGIWLKATSEKV